MPKPDYNFPREKRFLVMFVFCACLFVFVSHVQFYVPQQGEDVSILNWFFILMSLISGGLGLWWVRFRISIPVMEEIKAEEVPMYITNHWIVSLVFFWAISIFGIVLAIQAVQPLYSYCYSGVALLLMLSHWFQLQRIGGVMRHFDKSSDAQTTETTEGPAEGA